MSGAVNDVVFRVDAADYMGTGHLRRCLVLANELAAQGRNCRFICLDLPGFAANEVTDAGHRLHLLPVEAELKSNRQPETATEYESWLPGGWKRDAERTAPLATGCSVVVDHYGLDKRWHDAVAPVASGRMLVIDDLDNRPLGGDLLLNQNLSLGQTQPGLRGPKYALLDPALLEFRQQRGEPSTPPKVLLFLGGTDPGGLTAPIATAVLATDLNIDLHVVLTPASADWNELQTLAQSENRLTLHATGPGFRKLQSQMNIAIGAGGTTTWERAALGLPQILVELVPNQREVVAASVAAGIALTGPAVTPFSELSNKLRTLVEQPAQVRRLDQAGRRLCDGLGVFRVANRLLGDGVWLRPALLSDAETLYDWRCDPLTAAASLAAPPESLEHHRTWLRRILADFETRLYIAMAAETPVGTVRAVEQAGAWELSWTVAPEARGQGIASQSVACLIARLAQEGNGSARLIARVKPENSASQRIATRLGMRTVSGQEDRDGFLTFELETSPR